MGRDMLWIHRLPCKSIIPVGGRTQHIISGAAEYWAVVLLSTTKLSTGFVLFTAAINPAIFSVQSF